MRSNGNFLEVEFSQKNKTGQLVCGDCFMSQKLREEGRVISVLSDGLGSGIKASVLSTMTATMAIRFTAMNESILTTATSIMNTLPKDMIRKISYSTFCICDIDCFGNVKVIEYETPHFYLFRKGNFVDIPKEKIAVSREDLDNTCLWISEFSMEKEDRIIFFSDGVSQSGMGTPATPFGWEEGTKRYISEMVGYQKDISAKNLAWRVITEAEKNDGYTLKDDATCCVIYMREPRNLLLCSGPPYDEKNDKYLAKRVEEFQGRKVLCGGSTATIVSRELGRFLAIDMEIKDKNLPPISYMEGIDLVTEGILTLSRVEQLLNSGSYPSLKKGGPAEQVVDLLLNSDKITLLVGTRINIAHQDPNLPVELEIRRNVIKKINHLLESKFLKDVELTYI